MSLYDDDGNIRVTVADGDSRGRYAPDGSWYVNVDSGNKGIYGPNGCLNVMTWDGTYSVYNPDGGLWVDGDVLVLGKRLNSGGFYLNDFMAGQADGLYFDTNETDRYFQENTGPTLADDAGEVIGLGMSQRAWNGQTLAQVLAAQPNLLIPGSWSMSVLGGTSTAVESPPGTLTLVPDGVNSSRASQAIATVIGRTYRVSATADSTVAALAGTSAHGTQNGIVTFSPTVGVFYFVATATTTYIGFLKTSAAAVTVTAIVCKEVPGKHGVQATGTLKPTRQTSGAKFDGSDDNWLTTYTAGAGANFLVALVDVPASLSAVQYFAGSFNTDQRFFAGFLTTGAFRFGVGTLFPDDGQDWRGQQVVVGFSFDGSNVIGFADNSSFGAQAQGGVPTTSTTVRIGSLNNGGTASSFFGGSVKKLVAGREFIDLNTYRNIRAALLAS